MTRQKIIAAAIAATVAVSGFSAPARAEALPRPDAVLVSRGMSQTPILKGVRLDANDPLHMDLLVDTYGETFGAAESSRLAQYLQAAIALPEKSLWVNLSPYEKDRVIDAATEKTELGRVMLEQDYILKQFASSLTHPDTELGKRYWKAVGAGAPQSLTKVWIVPDAVRVKQDGATALVSSSRLAVMTDVDYQAMKAEHAEKATADAALAFVRKEMLPIIEKEVNEGALFAPLRQVFSAVVLASWIESRSKGSMYDSLASSRQIRGISLRDRRYRFDVTEKYAEGFTKGTYAVSRKETENGRKVKRQYVSGGEVLALKGKIAAEPAPLDDAAMREGCSAPEHAQRIDLRLGRPRIAESTVAAEEGGDREKVIVDGEKSSESSSSIAKVTETFVDEYVRGEITLDVLLRGYASDLDLRLDQIRASLISVFAKTRLNLSPDATASDAERAVMGTCGVILETAMFAVTQYREVLQRFDGLVRDKLLPIYSLKTGYKYKFSPEGWHLVRLAFASAYTPSKAARDLFSHEHFFATEIECKAVIVICKLLFGYPKLNFTGRDALVQLLISGGESKERWNAIFAEHCRKFFDHPNEAYTVFLQAAESMFADREYFEFSNELNEESSADRLIASVDGWALREIVLQFGLPQNSERVLAEIFRDHERVKQDKAAYEGALRAIDRLIPEAKGDLSAKIIAATLEYAERTPFDYFSALNDYARAENNDYSSSALSPFDAQWYARANDVPSTSNAFISKYLRNELVMDTMLRAVAADDSYSMDYLRDLVIYGLAHYAMNLPSAQGSTKVTDEMRQAVMAAHGPDVEAAMYRTEVYRNIIAEFDAKKLDYVLFLLPSPKTALLMHSPLARHWVKLAYASVCTPSEAAHQIALRERGISEMVLTAALEEVEGLRGRLEFDLSTAWALAPTDSWVVAKLLKKYGLTDSSVPTLRAIYFDRGRFAKDRARRTDAMIKIAGLLQGRDQGLVQDIYDDLMRYDMRATKKPFSILDETVKPVAASSGLTPNGGVDLDMALAGNALPGLWKDSTSTIPEDCVFRVENVSAW